MISGPPPHPPVLQSQGKGSTRGVITPVAIVIRTRKYILDISRRQQVVRLNGAITKIISSLLLVQHSRHPFRHGLLFSKLESQIRPYPTTKRRRNITKQSHVHLWGNHFILNITHIFTLVCDVCAPPHSDAIRSSKFPPACSAVSVFDPSRAGVGHVADPSWSMTAYAPVYRACSSVTFSVRKRQLSAFR